MKTTSKKIKNGRRPKKKNLFSIPFKFKIKMEDDLKKNKNGRRPQKNGRQTNQPKLT